MNNESTKPESAGHEPVSVSVRGLLIGVAGLAVLIGGALWLTWLLSESFTRTPDESAGDTPAQFRGRAPLVSNQRAARIRYEEEQRTKLNSYSWTDKNKTAARVPIARAMRLVQRRYQNADGKEQSP